MEAHKAEIMKSRRRENDCYYIMDTAADLDRKWPLIIAGKPDFIKVILLHSEEDERRKAKQGYGEGIDPKLLPQIVARAHAAGLTVSAHVDSAGDYRNALRAGVDEMAHLPGYYVGSNENILTYTLLPEDARETARRGIHVTPTANLTDYMGKPDEKQKTQTNRIRNLRLLKDAGVQFGIGTDSYGTDSLKFRPGADFGQNLTPRMRGRVTPGGMISMLSIRRVLPKRTASATRTGVSTRLTTGCRVSGSTRAI